MSSDRAERVRRIVRDHATDPLPPTVHPERFCSTAPQEIQWVHKTPRLIEAEQQRDRQRAELAVFRARMGFASPYRHFRLWLLCDDESRLWGTFPSADLAGMAIDDLVERTQQWCPNGWIAEQNDHSWAWITVVTPDTRDGPIESVIAEAIAIRRS